MRKKLHNTLRIKMYLNFTPLADPYSRTRKVFRGCLFWVTGAAVFFSPA